VLITADYVLSRFNRDQDRFQTGLFGVVAGSTVTGTQLTENYTVASANRLNGAADALVYENELVIENDSIGLNIEWEVNDRLSFEFDAHSSEAVSQPDGELNDNLQLIQGPLGINFALDYSADGVNIAVDDSGAFRGQAQFGGGDPRPGVDGFQDVDGFSPLGSVLRNIAIENTVDQYQFEGTWFGDTYTLRGGVSYTDYQVETNAISTGFFFQGLDACNGCAEAFTRNEIAAPSGFGVVVEFDVNNLVNQTFPTSIDQILQQFPPTFFGASEESTAIYLNFEKDFDIGDMPAQLIVGARHESTDVVGSAFQTFPIGLTITTNTEGSVLFAPNAAPEFFEVEADYSVFLPSIDFQIEPVENHVLRASYGKTIARPDLNALRPLTTISDYRPGNSTASAGNPGLKPYTSYNLDLSYEYYYDEGSYFSLAFFNKDVEDYIATEVVADTIPDINGDPLLDPQGRYVPTTSPSQVSTPVVSQPGDPAAIFQTSKPLNSVERSIDGWEIAIQHIFGESGFGMQANYTTVDSDAEFDPNNFTQQSILIGLSDSWNLVGFYEDEKFSFRLAANWRDEFLFSENQLRAPNEPVFFDEYTQWDFSSSYALTETLSVNFEVLNITGEDQKQFGRYKDQFLYENVQKPRYTLGIRGTF
jgi:TonB-dependent receptor